MTRKKSTLDVMAIGAHPDDVELAMGGTLFLLARRGYRVGILDLTRGERGTRGTASIRRRESAAAAKVLRLAWRGNAGLPDGGLLPAPGARERVASFIRRLRPELVLAVASDRRHPDHTAAEVLAHDASFVAGLRPAGGRAAPHRPGKFLRAATLRAEPPNVIVDITAAMEAKRNAVLAYRSQFVSDGRWIVEWMETRAAYYGVLSRIPYAEGFIQREPVLADDLVRLRGSSF
jgi:bacillithiol biosynthesis deacetylase BshB1